MSQEQRLRDVYGFAGPYDLPLEGATVGAISQFVSFLIGRNKGHLLQLDEADKLGDLLREAVTKCRAITEADKREHVARRGVP